MARPKTGGSRRRKTAARQKNLRRPSRARDESGNGVLLATITVHIRTRGPWTGGFSRAHPELVMEVLNRSDVDKDLSVSDHWISGHTPGEWAQEIAAYEDVVKVESLAEVGEGSLYRITYRNPPVIYLFRRLKLPIQFPLRIRAGVIRWEIVARRADLQTVVTYARRIDPDFRLVSIRDRPLRSHLPMLTESQHALLTQAMEAGYFAVPRGITLTDLARRLNRSKSAMSEAIAIIERKLLETALRPITLAP